MIEPKKSFQFSKAFQWEVPADLSYFDGHFPGNPVLPGIAIIDASLEAIRLERGMEEPPYVRKVDSAKFTQVIQPGHIVDLEIVENVVTWKRDGVQVAEVRLTF
jgi:3-hydroxymyristoyl/3-hydroxydecanoyl-(acyl carrier protein) dehydratase